MDRDRFDKQEAQDAVPRPLVIGWKEYVAFPEWGIRRMKVKIDTGARTSAIGVVGYEIYQSGSGEPVVELQLAPSRKHPERITIVRAPVLGMIHVKNTSCQPEERPLIEATICLGPVQKHVRLTIASRAGMRFPMILGRKALEGDFVVDVSKKYLLR